MAVAWGDATACGQHLAIFDDRLAARAHVGFGAAGEQVVGVVGTAGGFVAATAAAAGGHLEFFDGQGRGQGRLVVTGAAPAFVVATAAGAVWLGQWQPVAATKPGFGGHALWITPVAATGAIGAPALIISARAPIAIQAVAHGDRLGLFMRRAVVELALGASARVVATAALGTDGNTLVTLDGAGQPVRLTVDGRTATLARGGAAPAPPIDLAGPLGGPAAPIDLGRTAALFASGQRLGVLELATGRLRPVRATTSNIGRVVARPDGAVVVVWLEDDVLGLVRVAAP